jgi:alanine dehydrogenase
MSLNGDSEIILLSGRELVGLLDPFAAMNALREAYQKLADHPEDQGRSLGFAIDGGSIHVKAGLMPGSHAAFAAKVNVNLPGNWQTHHLPTIQGLVVLADTTNGRPLAVMESRRFGRRPRLLWRRPMEHGQTRVLRQ